jgi:hypothetical protein
MKVGMIFECGRNGADGKIYPYLAQQIRTDIEVNSIFLDSKPKLIEGSGQSAKNLLEIDCCERVIIVWDLRPPWQVQRTHSLCAVEDCNRIIEVLKSSQLTPPQLQCVRLICIEQELETLLLFDEQALGQYLESILRHPCRIRHTRRPERHENPKKVLYKIFQENHFRPYDDQRDAEGIIKLASFNKLRHCPAFVRFERRIRAL